MNCYALTSPNAPDVGHPLNILMCSIFSPLILHGDATAKPPCPNIYEDKGLFHTALAWWL